jgi:acyl-CoA synthetase (AMP-forming)/AMP-acid ligase II
MEFNIADLFESVADAIPDRLAVVCGDRRLTFRELDQRANRLANALASRRIGQGDHVGLYLYNRAEFVEGMLAAFKLRAVPININYRYVEHELAFLMKNADVKAMVYESDLASRVAAVAGEVPTLRLRIFARSDAGHDEVPGAVEFEALVASGSPERRFGPRSGDDLYIIYTGGTTGMPRGVMWRHEDVFYAGLQGGNPGGEKLERAEDLAPAVLAREAPMTMLPVAPFIHGAAQWGSLIGMFTGGKVVIAAGKSYDPRLVCKLVQDEGVNTMLVVGDAMARPLADALRDAGGSYDMSSLMVIASSGAILSDAVKDELQAHLPGTMILNNFGATETGHQGTAFSPGGRPTFYMDESNTVLGDDLRPVKPGSGAMGRLARRGRLPVGYYNDPEKTAATFLVVDGQRWVVPGDFATVEEDGQITVFGRGAMCINSGGEKIFPEEVESALKAHPGVLDAVVVGVPDERWGQRVAAVVEPRPGAAELTLAALDTHCRTMIAGYKVPRQLRVIERIVRHPSGKPDYRWAKGIALGGT